MPPVFVGDCIHNLDPKRRLTIPAEWRLQVGKPESVFILPGVDQKCLIVFAARSMPERLQRIRNYSIADSRARQFARVLASQSQMLPWDIQGRIRIKDELLAYANLKDEVKLVGAFEIFELWSPSDWATRGPMDPGQLAEAARYVGI